MRQIKFRSAHYFFESTENGDFSHFSYWGLINHKGEYDDTCFCSPSSNSSSYRKVEEQFTGLTDKNGVDIYEGDILKGGIYKEYEVKWDGENSGFGLSDYAITSFEVIGNIHQN